MYGDSILSIRGYDEAPIELLDILQSPISDTALFKFSEYDVLITVSVDPEPFIIEPVPIVFILRGISITSSHY